MSVLYHSYLLPWTRIQEEFERLKRYVIIALAFTLILGLAIPFIPVKQVDRTKTQELPPRLAKLVMEQKKKPPPKPKPVEKKKEEKKEEKKKEEKKKEEKKKEEKKPEKKPEKTAEQKRAEARKKAQKSGLLAFSDELAGLRDAPIAPQLSKGKLSKGAAAAKPVTRNVLTSNVTAGSGGINTSTLSSGIGRSSLEGRDTTQVESDIDKLAAAGSMQRGSGSSRPSRTAEDVSLVFDKNKGSIFSLYNRALRKDPTLQGKVVLKLTIAPDGSIVDVSIESSELNSPDFERKLLARIRSMNFGAKEVETLEVTYPIDFLPP